MQKTCTACKQVVYPLEQLKCLDQVWHKRCFKCQRCGMALNMGSYRGYEKKPYCVAHYPQPKRFTVVPDTPELQRVAQNSRVVSNANYYQRFCQAGGLDAQHRPSILSYQRSASAVPVLLGSHDNHVGHYTGANVRSSEHLLHHTPTNGRTVGDPRSYHHQPTSSDYQTTEDHFTHPAVESQEQEAVCVNPDAKVTATPLGSSNQDLKYRAMFDFQAREEDEVSFIEGDVIVNTDPITDGWMYGTVQRTGDYGMLPSNYLEQITS